jgi:hypothetical protein
MLSNFNVCIRHEVVAFYSAEIVAEQKTEKRFTVCIGAALPVRIIGICTAYL